MKQQEILTSTRRQIKGLFESLDFFNSPYFFKCTEIFNQYIYSSRRNKVSLTFSTFDFGKKETSSQVEKLYKTRIMKNNKIVFEQTFM